MYYQCIENGVPISYLNYKPNVPNSVKVVEVTDKEHDLITNKKTHYFDVNELKVLPYSESVLKAVANKELIEKNNRKHLKFLSDTDWMILRHIRQQNLGQPTTLSEQEYIELEQKRAAAANSIISV